MAKVGVLTIGQSPRTDATPSIQSILGDSIEVIEKGALDRFTEEELHLVAPSELEETYISRLRNGNSVKIGKKKLLPLLQEELSLLENEVDIILMLCTGEFTTLKTNKPILYPDKILFHTVKAILTDGKLGLIIPLEEQRETLIAKWHGLGVQLEIGIATPYDRSDIMGEAKKLKNKGVNMIVLDCMGYHEEHKKQAQKSTGLPIILPRTLLARVAKEYVS